MARTVFILGAGFSRPAGGPLLREMLDTENSANEDAVGDFWAEEEFGTLEKILRSLPEQERNIEGLFNVLSSGQLYAEAFDGYRASDLMNFLVDYVTALVRNRVGNPSRRKVYREFRDNFLEDGDIAVVTFNYDLVADQLLMEAHGGLDYALPATPKYRYFGLRGARAGPALLKLHGSLSWVLCGSCRTLWLHAVPADHKAGRSCIRTGCQGRLRTLIVPPMWNKEASARQIALVWEAAREEMLDAEHFLVVGFSFPPLDRAAMDLMRSVLRGNRRVRLDVYNGPGYDYPGLSRSLNHRLHHTGGRLEDLTQE